MLILLIFILIFIHLFAIQAYSISVRLFSDKNPLAIDKFQQLGIFAWNSEYAIIINQAIMFSNEDKSGDSFDPEFLTFRHNNTQAIPSSGRSIYSQRFDYKSLSKDPLFDACNSQREDINARTHKKGKYNLRQKQLRTVKSQEKYRELVHLESSNAEQIHDDLYLLDIDEVPVRTVASRRQIQFKQDTKKPNPQKGSRKINEQNAQKNCELKLKINRLVKSMKKEQMKQFSLQQQITEMETEIDGFDQEIEGQESNIAELRQISQQNARQCNRIIELINKVSSRNQQIARKLEDIEESVDSQENDIGTSRQDQVKDRLLCAKLKEGLNDLTKMKNSAESRAAILDQQIQYMQSQIEQMKAHQAQIMKIFRFRMDSSSSSHNSQSQSQNQSHNSSSGSNRESVYYY